MAYSDELLKRYVSLASLAISERSTTGEDARFSEQFEAIELELAKAQSMHADGPVDWVRVRECSEFILQTLSKDLRVACWLSWALYQAESFAGLVAGCAMIEHFCRDNWQDVFPRRAKTRAAALAWLITRMDQVISSDVPVKDQLPLFRNLEKHLQGIDEVLSAELKDDAPLLLPLQRRLAGMIKSATQARPQPATLVAQVKEVAASLFSSPVGIENERDAHTAFRAQQAGARPLCAWWLRNKASDVRALRLNRTMTWLAVEKLPECNAERITPLRCPAVEEVKGYRDRFEQGHYADLVVELEASFGLAPFWFDGQHLIWECLRGLNAQVAMRELEVQFALFLSRMPGITQLRFQDGRPFADGVTLNWIDSHVTPRLPDDRESEPVGSADVQLPWNQVFEEQLPILRQEGLKSVALVFKQHIQSAVGERAKFYWRWTLARLCYHGGKLDLARSQLEVLEEQLRQGGLKQWEPDLYVDVLRLLYTCCESLPQNKVVREDKEALYRRLSHLDIEAVLE
jgi:type VI secretion system protein VasJ